MLAIKGVITLTFLLHFSSSTVSPSWVYNAPRTLFDLAGSASAAASAPTSSASYITDFRRKSAKVTQLQEEKDATDPFPEDNEEESSAENANEASPSLLHKKIGKILTKLRLIAQIKNAYYNRHNQNDESMEEDTNVTSTKNDTKPVPTSSVNITILEHIQQIPATPKKSPKAETEAPVKVDLEIEQINDKVISNKKNEKLKEQEPNRLGSLGVFFVELLGSIVGLTYGAVAQIAAGGQSPVTISTSEGL